MKHGKDRGTDAAMFVVVPPQVLFWWKHCAHPRRNSLTLTVKVIEIRGEQVRVGIEAPNFIRLLPGEALRSSNLDFENHSQDSWPMRLAELRKVKISRAGINQLLEDEISFDEEAEFHEQQIALWSQQEAETFSRAYKGHLIVLAYFWVAERVSDQRSTRLAFRSSIAAEDLRISRGRVSNSVHLR